MESTNERRGQPRYRLGEGAIALSANISGHIQDISLGGLSFVYLQSDGPKPNGETIDILDGKHNFFMEAIPCRTITEQPLVNRSSFSTMRMVQRSVEFGQLASHKQSELQAYIARQANAANTANA